MGIGRRVWSSAARGGSRLHAVDRSVQAGVRSGSVVSVGIQPGETASSLSPKSHTEDACGDRRQAAWTMTARTPDENSLPSKYRGSLGMWSQEPWTRWSLGRKTHIREDALAPAWYKFGHRPPELKDHCREKCDWGDVLHTAEVQSLSLEDLTVGHEGTTLNSYLGGAHWFCYKKGPL